MMSSSEFDSDDVEIKEKLRRQECKIDASTDEEVEIKSKKDIIYGTEDVPPWYLCIILGLQHYMTMVGANLTIPFILAPLLCIAEDDPARGQLVSSIIFVSGLITLLQSTFGSRLPIVQGGSFAYLVPTISILATSFPSCEEFDLSNMTRPEKDELWMVRMREIQGAIIVSSLFEVVMGFTGAIGFLITWISPLAIVSTITLIGLSLFKFAANFSSGNWGIAALTSFLLLLFSQYLSNVKLPYLSLTEKKIKWTKSQIFNLFPVILAILLAWALCAILTITEALSPNSSARTDTNLDLIKNSAWFYVPYPFQWGLPTFSVSGSCGMLAAVVSSIIDSVGDYYACARLSGVRLPPKHAVNRGIGIEGVGGVIAGIIGTGNCTASYSENIGAIRMTKVASRRVIQTGALLMILCGCFAKFGAVCVTLPDPVVGGVFLIMFSVIAAVGLSNLQVVDLNSSRNLMVLGISLFFGLSIPEWLKSNPGSINTGYEIVDQVITVLLTTNMFVGGVLGVILDNSIPGTEYERGITKWREESGQTDDNEEMGKDSCYDLPFGMEFIRRVSWCSKIPISPTYATHISRKRTNSFNKL